MSSFVPCYVNQLCAISLRLCARFSIRVMLCVADNEVFVSASGVCVNCFSFASYGAATRTVIIACLCDFELYIFCLCLLVCKRIVNISV